MHRGQEPLVACTNSNSQYPIFFPVCVANPSKIQIAGICRQRPPTTEVGCTSTWRGWEDATHGGHRAGCEGAGRPSSRRQGKDARRGRNRRRPWGMGEGKQVWWGGGCSRWRPKTSCGLDRLGWLTLQVNGESRGWREAGALASSRLLGWTKASFQPRGGEATPTHSGSGGPGKIGGKRYNRNHCSKFTGLGPDPKKRAF